MSQSEYPETLAPGGSVFGKEVVGKTCVFTSFSGKTKCLVKFLKLRSSRLSIFG